MGLNLVAGGRRNLSVLKHVGGGGAGACGMTSISCCERADAKAKHAENAAIRLSASAEYSTSLPHQSGSCH